MYHSDFFFLNMTGRTKAFIPVVTSVYKVLSDISYVHHCDEQEMQSYPDNTIAFIRCINGKGQIRLKNSTFTLNKYDCIFLHFKDIQEYRSLTNIWEYRWANFSADYTNDEFEFGKIYTTAFSEREEKAFVRILSAGQGDLKNKDYINHLFLDYYYSIMLENQFDEEALVSEAKNGLIDEICTYIHQKLYSKISIDEIAEFFKISPRRLHQIFTSELGISPKKYILKKKMEEGYKLLVQTSTPINQIAYMLCFSSPYHFTNGFKKTFSQSPSEVRKMEKKYENNL